MSYKIQRAAVIGAGTMGAAIAAHLANAGVAVSLLDITPDRLTRDEEKKGLTLADPPVRSRIARQGLEQAKAARPASFFTGATAARVSIGNLEDDFDRIAGADWIIEVIVEKLDIKQLLMERIDTVRAPHAIVSTNTSGLRVAEIAAGRTQGFREHFLGTHFFNPPRYLKLLEVIPLAETLPEVVQAITAFGETRLGKGVVLCKDTPNFIANRMAFGSAAFGLDYVLENGYTVEEVDAITGPLTGRPKTATFRLMDLVGIDVWEHVGSNLAPAILHDEMAQKYLHSERVNGLIHTLVERGWLGNKAKQGFYKEVRDGGGGKAFWPLNLQTLEYEPPQKPRFESVGKTRNIEGLGERLKALVQENDRAAELVRSWTYQSLAYASSLISEVADTPYPIDCAMRWGFGHEAGPFELWDLLGVGETLEKMKQAGFPAAGWVEEMIAAGKDSFYERGGDHVGTYNPSTGSYEVIKDSPAVTHFRSDKGTSKAIQSNSGASLVDLGDGVAGIELHAKMNVLDEGIFDLIAFALDRAEWDYEALVIGSDAENFSVGANLLMVLGAAQSGMWDQLGAAVKKMQDLNQRLRYFPRPVVGAPAGLALGGGAEILMHTGRVVAAAELYAGLVEAGSGVIPAGGGTKEMLRRILNPPMATQNADALPFLQRIFEQVGMVKVSTSADEALEMGILRPGDRVVLNRDHLLANAKQEARRMAEAGYRPPLPEKIYAAGRDALAALRVGVYMLKEGGTLSEYDAHLGNTLAYVMTGGELSAPTWVEEQYILDLEREAFLSLCGEEKSRQRMLHILQTGKPLRN